MEAWLSALKLFPLLTELTSGWDDAERLKTALELLEWEKSALGGCRSPPPSGTVAMTGCLTCPVWLLVAVSEAAVELPGPAEHTGDKWWTCPAADVVVGDGVVVMGD